MSLLQQFKEFALRYDAETGNPAAMLELAEKIIQTKSQKRYPQAIELLQTLANTGHPKAFELLGECRKNGFGVILQSSNTKKMSRP